MDLCWFAQSRGIVPNVDLTGVLASVPGATRALIHTPAATHDPYLHDGAPPSLSLQVYFGDIGELEAALSGGGALMALLSLLGPDFDHQAMLVRDFPVASPGARGACTYLVAYEGTADDLPAWLAHVPVYTPGRSGIRKSSNSAFKESHSLSKKTNCDSKR